jgi:FAD/FMN-containing dehydrogenase
MSEDFCTALKTLLGEQGVLTSPEDRAPFERDWRGLSKHPALAVAFSKTAEQTSDIIKLCTVHGIAIVPQGGNTGLVAGGVPIANTLQLILSLNRMNAIRSLDLAADCIIAEAGVPLAAVQKAAADADRLFPVSFAADGSAQIGGVISTNAGGVQVLSYGNMRAQVLGLEVVLADGTIWHGLNALPKDNTGYDLKQIFIGAEGTLGIITAACLRLHPAPRAIASALVGTESAAQAMALFQSVRRVAGPALTLCEFMAKDALALGGTAPFEAPAYLLLEVSALEDDAEPQTLIERVLETALEDGTALDAVIAQSEREREALMALREDIPEGELHSGGAVKHDISVPLGRMAEMVSATEALIAKNHPGCRLNIFGHLGDGNLHINIRPPEGKTLDDLAPVKTAITTAVESLAVSLGGSFSAEHGIGQFRLSGMAAHKSPEALSLMRRLKAAFDPAGIFNPGKTIPPETSK